MINLPLKQIIDRHKSLGAPSYMEIFSVDDTKKKKNSIRIEHHDLDKLDYQEISEKVESLNFGSQGVFINLNPLKAPKRNKDNIKKIQYVFIDLDDAKEDHNEIIKQALKKLDISFSYNAQSGSGYHFLIPINFETSKEPLIKGFLKYLKVNFTDKVDLATADTPRLLRVPESLHNKNGEFRLKTLFSQTFDSNTSEFEEILINNSLNVEKYQAENIEKGMTDNKYLESVTKEDSFFSEIFNTSNNIIETEKILNNSNNRNGVFIKNLAIFVHKYPDYSKRVESFLLGWEASRVPAIEGWIKKSLEQKWNINYKELLIWAKENKIKSWIKLLNEQLSTTFLDKFEIYYLEDEKKESNYILYFPESNYYVQKSDSEVMINIQYKCLDWGIDLEKELNAKYIDNWDKQSVSAKKKLLMGLLSARIIKENRIKLVFNINYEPTNEKFIYLNNKKYFNTYNKTELWDHCESKKEYNFPYIKYLIMNLCGDDTKNYDYFNKWLGWIIQRPTEKLPTAIIFQGAQGSGKGTLKNCVLDQIFGNNCQEINQTQLEASFNDYLLGKQIMMANEVMHNENRQTLPNVLKNLVTDEYLTINIKFKKPLVARNYCHWIFCTNSDNPIKLDSDDRRYSVFYSEKLKGGGRKAAEFVKTLKSNLDYELKEYLSYLKSLEIDYFEVHEPIMTEAKKDIQDINKDSIVRFIESLSELPDLDIAFENYCNDKFIAKEISGEYHITTDSFYLLYLGYCEKFSEVGKFNKQTFSRKLRTHKLDSVSKYVTEEKTNIRVISLKNIAGVLKYEQIR